MSFAAPGWLALLLALPLLWWVFRLLSRPPVVRVASVLLYRQAATTEEAAAPRRRLDPLLACLLGAITLLALSAAGLGGGESPQPSVLVVVDDSVSMQAWARGSVESAKERALTRARRLLEQASPGCVLEEEALEQGNFSDEDGLPGSLAVHLEAARAAGRRGLVLVSDRAWEVPPGVVVIGPEEAPRPNVALTRAVLGPEGEARITVSNHGSEEVRLVLAHEDDGVGKRAPATIAPGASAVVSLPAPRRGEVAAHYVLLTEDGDTWEDGLYQDDRFFVVRRGGVGRVRLDSAVPAPQLERVLEAIAEDVTRERSADADVVVRYRMPVSAAEDQVTLHVAPLRTAPSALLTEAVPDPLVHGRSVYGSGSSDVPLPLPATRMVAPHRATAGRPIWSDPLGALAVTGAPEPRFDDPVDPWMYTDLGSEGTLPGPREAVILVDPDDARSDWHRDPSLPVLFAAVLEDLVIGPDRLLPTARGWVAPSESRLPDAGVPAPSLEKLRSIVGHAPDDEDPRPARLAALGAVALLAGALILLVRGHRGGF